MNIPINSRKQFMNGIRITANESNVKNNPTETLKLKSRTTELKKR
jgi:hypothetical protein